MRLEIHDPEQELDRDFGHWLCSRIRQHFLASVDVNKLKQWDNFFETSDVYVNIYGVPVKAYAILLESVKNLTVSKLPDKMVISVNRNQSMPGLDRVKTYTLLKLVTFGNMSISGYPVFIDTLQYFADNINDFVDLYEDGI